MYKSYVCFAIQKHASEDGWWVRSPEQRFQKISCISCGYPCIFAFCSCDLQVWKSRTKASFSQVQLAVFEGVSHECFVFTTSACSFWRMSRTKAVFRNLNLHFLKEFLHKSFVFTTSTCSFWKKSHTKASHSQLQLAVLEGSLARISRLRDSGCTKSFVSQNQKHASEDDGWVRSAPQRFQRISWVPCGYPCILLSALFVICNFEGSLARKLCFATSTCSFWRRSCTKASFSQLQLAVFERSRAQNALLRDSGCTKSFVLQYKSMPLKMGG